ADAHGKNVALLHDPDGTVRLAPLYDTVPTMLYPSLRTNAAMSVSAKNNLLTITANDIVAEATHWPLSEKIARQTVIDILDRLTSALNAVPLPSELATLVRNRTKALMEHPHA
ncbi:MAG: HipA domain-containing protein, partial [Actinomycetota bacterium]